MPFSNAAGPGPATEVLAGGLRIAAPRGYCLDRDAVRQGTNSAFLLYGTCRGLEEKGPRAAAPAILTAAVAPAANSLSDQELTTLATYLRSEDGRRMLSRNGTGRDVTIESIDKAAGMLLIHASDAPSGELATDYWRGIFAQSGSLVTVTVSGLREAPLAASEAQALVIDFVAAIRAANSEAAPKSGAGLTETATTETTEEPRGLGALLKRLL